MLVLDEGQLTIGTLGCIISDMGWGKVDWSLNRDDQVEQVIAIIKEHVTNEVK